MDGLELQVALLFRELLGRHTEVADVIDQLRHLGEDDVFMTFGDVDGQARAVLEELGQSNPLVTPQDVLDTSPLR